MRYLTLILVVFICTISHSQSTDSIYALQEDLGSPTFLHKVNPTNANSTLISTSPPPFNSPFASPGKKFIDPHRNKYCFVVGPNYLDSLIGNGNLPFPIVNNFSLPHQKDILISIDLSTGIWEGVVIEYSHFLEYNCSDSTYYALGSNSLSGMEEPYLVKIDPLTGYSQAVSANPLPVIASTFQGYPFQQPVIDPINKRYVFHGAPFPNPLTGIVHIYAVDLVSGNLVSDYIVNDIDAIHQMVFNCRDTAFYAMKVNYSPNERYLIKIDPFTFATTQISTIPYDVWYLASNSPVITVSNNKYVFVGVDSALTEFKIYSFDLDDGTLSYSPTVNHSEVTSIASYPVCKIEPVISSENCSGLTVDFTSPSGGIEYDWDFGDPLSGLENSSDLQNPQHEFTIPGSYQIRLVINSCYTNDTVYKTIDVEFIINPLLGLGPDTLLCANESLQLSVENNFSSVLWNTGAATPEISITTGGIYFVTVTDSSGCSYSDTTQVSYKPEETLTLNYMNDSLIGVPYSSNNYWTLNGVPIDSSGVNSLFINQPGIYQLIGTINGCVYTDEVDLNSTLCNLSVSPNPTNGIITINANLNVIQNIDIMSLGGKIIKKYSQIDSSVFTVDISELARENYFFRVLTNNCESILKIVKL